MTSYILTTFLSIGSPQGIALPDRDAPRYAAKALYQELGLNDVASRIEKKYIKLDDYKELQYIGIVARAVTEKRITYRWEF